MKGYKAILEIYLRNYFPYTPDSSLETYQKLDPVKADEIRAAMSKLVPSGFTEIEAWRGAWHSLRQQRYMRNKK